MRRRLYMIMDDEGIKLKMIRGYDGWERASVVIICAQVYGRVVSLTHLYVVLVCDPCVMSRVEPHRIQPSS